MNPRDLIDYAAQDDAVNFRAALYSAIHDRVTAHIEAKKQEIAQGLVTQEEETKPKMMKKEEEKWHMKKEEVEELDEEQLDELSKDSLNSYLHKGVSKFKQNAPFMSSSEKQKKVAHLQKAHSKLKAKGGKFEEFEYGMHEELDEEQLDELSKDSLNSYLHKGVSKFKQNAATMSPAEKQKKVSHLQKAHSKLKAKGGKFEEFEYGMNEEEEEDEMKHKMMMKKKMKKEAY